MAILLLLGETGVAKNDHLMLVNGGLKHLDKQHFIISNLKTIMLKSKNSLFKDAGGEGGERSHSRCSTKKNTACKKEEKNKKGKWQKDKTYFISIQTQK